MVANAVNPLSSTATQDLSQNVGRISATLNGSPVSAGTAINVTLTSSDKSGDTCLVYIANGANVGTPCKYPSPGSTPGPVTIAHVNDGIVVQYNDGPMQPGATFSIAGSAPGANVQPTAVSMNNPAPGVGHTTSGGVSPWGGGIVYSNGEIYVTLNSASTPIGVDSYSSGTAGANVSNMTASASLTSAPAGGLVMGPDGRLWGTEQNNTKVFAITTSGSVSEYGISCSSGTSGGSASNGTLFGPQTGITTDGTNIYALCADVAGHNPANNSVTEINPSSGATVATCTPGHEGNFTNGAIYSNGKIYTEEQKGGGANLGGSSGGYWLSFPVSSNLASCASGFAETNVVGTGDGNVVLLGSALYSETDNISFSTSLSGGTNANPAWDGVTNVSPPGGGGLVQDAVLGSNWFFGTASGHDLDIHTAWSSGNNVTPSSTNVLPLSAGGTPETVGDCDVALNNGGGFGILQLPDGKLAWSHATAGLEPASQSWICFANL
jgi:hypothetical protein